MAPRIFSESDFVNSSPAISSVVPRVFAQSDFISPTKAPLTTHEKLVGQLGSLLGNLTLDAGDEIVAGGAAGLDALGRATGLWQGAPLKEAYGQRLSQIKDLTSRYEEESPIGAGINTAIGMLGIPLPKILSKGKGVVSAAKNILKGAGLGAALSGAQEFLSSEGDLQTRAQEAAEVFPTGAVLGGVAQGVTDTLVPKLSKLSDAFLKSGIGATAADFGKSWRMKGRKFQQGPEGEKATALMNAIREVKEMGGFKGSKTPQGLVDTNQGMLNAIENELSDVLSQADDVIPENIRIKPKYTATEQFINKQQAAERKYLRDAFQEIKEAHSSELDGSLQSLQAEKRALYKKVYGPNQEAKETLSKYVARDLKNTIETWTDGLAKEGLIDSNLSGAVKKLNKESGALQEVQPILARQVTREEGAAPLAWLVNALKTTGGTLTTPTLIGASLGGYQGDGSLQGFLSGAALGGLTSRPGRLKASDATKALANILQARGAGTAGLLARNVEGVPLVENAEAQGDLVRGLNQYMVNKNSPTMVPVNNKKVTLDTIDEPLVKAVQQVESANNPNAIGPKTKYGTAKGLMQLIDSTGKEWHKKLGFEGEYDPFNPEQNLAIGTAYLGDLMSRYKTPELALAAYNWGMGNLGKLIKRLGTSDYSELEKHLPSETRRYVSKVLNKRDSYIG